MRKTACQIVFLLAVVGALAGPVAAGDYQLILGKGTEVCEACLKNLQQQPVENAVCDRQYDPAIGLHSAQWTELILPKHAEFYKRVSNLIDRGNEGRRDPDLGDSKQLEEFLHVMSMTRVSMATASVDIDNDGNFNQLLRYQSGNCRKEFHGYHGFYQSALLSLADDQRTIDYARTDLLVQHYSKTSRYPVGLPHFQIYQVFTHKGAVYFDKWDGGGSDKEDPITLKLDQPDVNTLSVYRVNKNQTGKICQIRLFPPTSAPHN